MQHGRCCGQWQLQFIFVVVLLYYIFLDVRERACQSCPREHFPNWATQKDKRERKA